MRNLILAACAASALLAGPAAAGTPYEARAVCPVDGREFTWTSTASYSTWGSTLDAQPIGSWHFPLTIPQCPDSRFPLYKDEFTDAEKAAIQALVATPEYAAVKDESSYYLTHFVMSRLETLEPLGGAWLLVQATWQVREDADRYARYAAQAVPAMDAGLPGLKDSEPADWWYLQIAVANVQRQAGDFDGATARLDALTGDMPAEGQPAERIAETRRLIAARDRSVGMLPDARGGEDDHDH